MVIATNLTSVCCVYKEKIVKKDSYRRTKRLYKFRKFQYSTWIIKNSDITTYNHRFLFDAFVYSSYFACNLFSQLALDFRTFLINMKMSSSLSKIPGSGMNVFKSNSRIIQNKTYCKILLTLMIYFN